MADARCYAARYPDLRSLCAGGSPCRFAELLNHFQQHGRKENRTYHCFTVRPVPPRCKPGPKQIEEQTTPVDTVHRQQRQLLEPCKYLYSSHDVL